MEWFQFCQGILHTIRWGEGALGNGYWTSIFNSLGWTYSIEHPQSMLWRCNSCIKFSWLSTRHWMGKFQKNFISGTRDITPGYRVAKNYGLIVGGAVTKLHNPMMVLLKDYHIRSTGSIHDAVSLAGSVAGPIQKIGVECQSIIEAATGGADVVLLHFFTWSVENYRKGHKITRDNVDVISQQDLIKGYQIIEFYLTDFISIMNSYF